MTSTFPSLRARAPSSSAPRPTARATCRTTRASFTKTCRRSEPTCRRSATACSAWATAPTPKRSISAARNSTKCSPSSAPSASASATSTTRRAASCRKKPRSSGARNGPVCFKMSGMRSMLFLLAFALAAPTALAQDFRTGFWAGGDIGVGFLKRKFDVTNDRDDTKPAVAIRGGYAFTPRLLLGVEAGGWTLESSNRRDDARGQGISTLYLFGQAYPFQDRLFFVKGGVGGARCHTHPNSSDRRAGS